MVIDVESFMLDTEPVDSYAHNFFLAEFLSYAQNRFDLILVGHFPDTALTRKLETLKLSDDTPCRYQDLRQKILNSAKSWEDMGFTNAAVVISPNHNIAYVETHLDYDMRLYPSDIAVHGSFHYFWDDFEETHGFLKASRAIEALATRVKLHDIKLQNTQRLKFENPDEMWKDVIKHPAIKKLCDHFNPDHYIIKHPQDELRDTLKIYFNLASAGQEKEGFNLTRELIAARRWIRQQLWRGNFEQDYNHDVKDDDGMPIYSGLKSNHRTMINQAIQAIHDIIRTAPRLP